MLRTHDFAQANMLALKYGVHAVGPIGVHIRAARRMIACSGVVA